jgi:transposase
VPVVVSLPGWVYDLKHAEPDRQADRRPRREHGGGPVGEVPAAALDHRRFWDALDAIAPQQLPDIERLIGQAAADRFGLDLSGLVLDMTNFATFIDTGNQKTPIAQRGKARQKRHDLRLAGLALVVTRDGGVPVVSRACPGNRPDVTRFTAVVDELARPLWRPGRGRRRADRGLRRRERLGG